MNFFGVGAGEALLVVVLALLLVGPNRFPEVARQAGRYYRLARRYTTEVMADVRAAVDDLEQEIREPGDDLRSIREIGAEFTGDLRAAKQDIDQAGRDTQAAAAGTPEMSDTVAASTIAIATEEEPMPVETMSPAAEGPAAPVSFRPSKRADERTPTDPFEALEAKRARERERDAVDNGHQ